MVELYSRGTVDRTVALPFELRERFRILFSALCFWEKSSSRWKSYIGRNIRPTSPQQFQHNLNNPSHHHPHQTHTYRICIDAEFIDSDPFHVYKSIPIVSVRCLTISPRFVPPLSFSVFCVCSLLFLKYCSAWRVKQWIALVTERNRKEKKKKQQKRRCEGEKWWNKPLRKYQATNGNERNRFMNVK